MRSAFALALTSLAALGLITAAACSADTEDAPSPGDDADAASPDRRPGSGGSSGSEPDPDPDPSDGSSPDPADAGKSPGKVYAHTSKVLYLFEPVGKTLTRIGPVKCLDADDLLLDLALDKDGAMYGTSLKGLVKIEPSDASCSYVKKDGNGKYPNALTFVPAGVLDPTKEVLVGYASGAAATYVRIDVVTGAVTNIGTLNAADASAKFRSSGDFVSLLRGGTRKTYLTVRAEAADAATADQLAEVDPITGRIGVIVGSIGQRDLYGFAQWGGTGYGFDNAGHVLAVDLANGSSTTITTLTEDGGALPWFGAGVTTSAPNE